MRVGLAGNCLRRIGAVAGQVAGQPVPGFGVVRGGRNGVAFVIEQRLGLHPRRAGCADRARARAGPGMPVTTAASGFGHRQFGQADFAAARLAVVGILARAAGQQPATIKPRYDGRDAWCLPFSVTRLTTTTPRSIWVESDAAR